VTGRLPRYAALGLLLLLAGCRTLPEGAPAGPSTAEQAAIALLADWHARGRVAVHSATDGFNASFDWRETAGRSELDVRGPLGAGAAHISRSDELIRIDTGSGAPLDIAAPFASLEPELTARLGFPLPVDSLRYWVLGVPAPAEASEPLAAGFRQGGWEVSFSAFAAVPGAPGPLPVRLALTRGPTRIRVLVSSWQVGGP